MEKVLQAQAYAVCHDCLLAIVYGDFSHLDWYDPDEALRRQDAIENGMDAIPGHLTVGDPEAREEFSTQACECCNTRLAGERHQVVAILPSRQPEGAPF